MPAAKPQPSCALVLITHPGIGSALLQQAQRIFASGAEQELHGRLTGLYLLEVDDNLPAAQLDAQFAQCIAAIEHEPKVLLLTDLAGATPATLALRQARQHGWPLLSGLSLPMLLKAITYRQQPVDELIGTVIDGTQAAVRLLQAHGDRQRQARASRRA